MSQSKRAREKLAQDMIDASTSGSIPLIGIGVLAFIFAAVLRLIF